MESGKCLGSKMGGIVFVSREVGILECSIITGSQHKSNALHPYWLCCSSVVSRVIAILWLLLILSTSPDDDDDDDEDGADHSL